MSQTSSRNRKTARRGAEPRKKLFIGVGLGAGLLVLIVAIIYFLLPKSTPITALKVEDLAVGTGRAVQPGDKLTVEYTGWVSDKYDKVPFDSSNLHQDPFQFVLGTGDVIDGWNQGLVGMKVGGKRRLTVPANLAYGAKGALNGRIPPNSALIFEIDLIGAQGPAAAQLPPTKVTKLQIEDLVVGSGPAARNGDTLSVNYTGWLENGTKFDSSLDPGRDPIEFVLGHGDVIPGWEQGMLGMKVGGKRRLTIPPALAYGSAGAGDTIPPNAALIFEVELLAIK